MLEILILYFYIINFNSTTKLFSDPLYPAKFVNISAKSCFPYTADLQLLYTEKWLTQMIGARHPMSPEKQHPHRQQEHDFPGCVTG